MITYTRFTSSHFIMPRTRTSGLTKTNAAPQSLSRVLTTFLQRSGMSLSLVTTTKRCLSVKIQGASWPFLAARDCLSQKRPTPLAQPTRHSSRFAHFSSKGVPSGRAPASRSTRLPLTSGSRIIDAGRLPWHAPTNFRESFWPTVCMRCMLSYA